MHANPDWPRARAFIAELGCEVCKIDLVSTGSIHWWEQTRFAKSCGRGTAISLIGTGPVFKRQARHLMFVHDLNSLIIPEAFSKPYRLWSAFAKYEAIRNADRLVCFTNYVKGTICSRLKIPEDRIDVIPQGPGISSKLLKGTRVYSKDERVHFLCVGSLQRHKNLPAILTAWKMSRLADRGVRLLVVGKPQAAFVPGEHSSEVNIPGVSYTGFIDDERLGEYYRSAIAVVYPSLHEGFGLPIVEGFYAGTPAITSNCSCLPEVAGDAALLVDPIRPESIASALSTLFENAEIWQTLCVNAVRRASVFQWSKAAERLWESIART